MEGNESNSPRCNRGILRPLGGVSGRSRGRGFVKGRHPPDRPGEVSRGGPGFVKKGTFQTLITKDPPSAPEIAVAKSALFIMV